MIDYHDNGVSNSTGKKYPTLFKKIMETYDKRYDELADSLSISVATLYRYANGESTPPVDVAVLIIDILGLRLDYVRKLFEPAY